MATSSSAVVVKPSEVKPSVAFSGVAAASPQALKTLYQVDHQVELLHLQAEAEVLLQQLQVMKQQKPSGL